MNIERYNQILEILCKYYGIEYNGINKISNFRHYRYILLLLLKKYNCVGKRELLESLDLKSTQAISNNYKRAHDKLLINRNFREEYFEMEKIVEQEIK
ncbi:MAG: hypothetical protein AB6733_01525 [Clostridiaceae bacterium]